MKEEIGKVEVRCLAGQKCTRAEDTENRVEFGIHIPLLSSRYSPVVDRLNPVADSLSSAGGRRKSWVAAVPFAVEVDRKECWGIGMAGTVDSDHFEGIECWDMIADMAVDIDLCLGKEHSDIDQAEEDIATFHFERDVRGYTEDMVVGKKAD